MWLRTQKSTFKETSGMIKNTLLRRYGAVTEAGDGT